MNDQETLTEKVIIATMMAAVLVLLLMLPDMT